MLADTLGLAVCVAILGALALRGTDGLTKPISAAVCFVVLPLIASYGFVTLSSLSGGG